jgi:mono/diheme cytochrome c family protein
LLKNSGLRSILGGAALPRCAIRPVLRAGFLAAAVTILLALPFSTPARADTGADTYKKKCSACHGVNGTGETMLGKNLKLRPLASPEVQKQSDDELTTIITKGKNRMPPFNRRLSKDQIANVVKHIRSLKK